MKASTFLKQMVATIVSVVRAKSTSLKTRLLILQGVILNKKLLVTAINHKIHAIMGHDDDDGSSRKAVVLYTAVPSYVSTVEQQQQEEEDSDDDDYLTHCLFHDDDNELVNAAGSAIDVVRDATEGEGAEFRLEDEIDHVADVFIRRIHKQLKLQKLESFRRFCEMMERSV